MDWIKQNKFLSSFLLVLLIAGGALGFLAFSAMGKYNTAYADYQAKASELNQLQTQQPYPEDANVKKMQEVQKAHQAAIESLHKDLFKAQLPLKKDLSPEKFQDNLRDAVRRVQGKAAERGGIEMPADFYLGFNAYQGVPPKQEAAAPLGRMLDSMELAINMLLESQIIKLDSIKHDPLPEEGAAPSPSSSPTPANQRDRDKDKDKSSGLVQRRGFEIQFESTEASFQNFLQALISSKQQFFIPVWISIASSMEKTPSKSETADISGGGNTTAAVAPVPADPSGGAVAQPQPPVAPPQPVPAAASGKERAFVVGNETLKVTMRIEVVEFSEPAPAPAK
jgi:hypothetical protein